MKNRVSYQEHRKEAEKKGRERAEYINSRGKNVVVRRNHMSEENIIKKRRIYKEFIKNIPLPIKNKAGSNFFNPYRYSGVYFGCIQSLFLLGSNEWHSYNDVIAKLKEVMMKMRPDSKGIKPWEKFEGRAARKNEDGSDSARAKDVEGRMKHNMRVLQRVYIEKEANPYGYKLRQALACIDIKIEDKIFWYFRLNTTFKNEAEVKPIFDQGKGKGISKLAAK
jgi:hypothetical protein